VRCPLRCALETWRDQAVMFFTDYPYEAFSFAADGSKTPHREDQRDQGLLHQCRASCCFGKETKAGNTGICPSRLVGKQPPSHQKTRQRRVMRSRKEAEWKVRGIHLAAVELHQQFVDSRANPFPLDPGIHLGGELGLVGSSNWECCRPGNSRLPSSELAAGLAIREPTIRSPGRHW